MTTKKKSTYLSRVESDYFSRNWYRRGARLLCHLLFTSKKLRKAQFARCLVVEISEGDATVRIGATQIPDELYLVIGKFEVVVGCIVVRRDLGLLHLRFVKLLKPELVDRLSRMKPRLPTLESPKPEPISASEGAQPMRRPMPSLPHGAQERGMDQFTEHSKKL
ncbi:hypothetical protein FY036_18145 [Mesorhizobium microcysteis]|uniref:PilZ domain-containing protein n=1 Tax=Neoaquamicrobium microcysteis TaxID=2682781 RepID=A0A5D4GRH5_9HYPH|nr:hypothetical protein [Mesorhizobium microcysteis]TYR30632.1 hypothetical protein FY036_18145 [Mesorhizobium microcysteis]